MNNEIKITEENGIENITYIPSGVCCRIMNFKIKNNVILDSEFIGGCNGNLKGIKSLIQGMDINEVINKLNGIQCGGKETSCPDQLSRGLMAYIKEKSATLANS